MRSEHVRGGNVGGGGAGGTGREEDNGGDLPVEPIGRSVLPFSPIPSGVGTAPPR